MASPVVARWASAHLKGRNRFLNMWMHDVAERLQIRRKGIARDAGLEDSYDVGTYPSEPSSVVNVNNGGWLKGMVAGGLMSLAGAGAVGVGLHSMGLLDRQAIVRSVEQTAEPMEFDIVIESVDGEVQGRVE
jgi:hypothetical protein